MALTHLWGPVISGASAPAAMGEGGMLGAPHFAPKAKRIIYLFMAGGPSQLETFDYKPLLNERNGDDLPDSVRMGQRLTGMSGNQSVLPLAGSVYPFQQHGKSGAWVSELLPHTAGIVDDLCIVRSLYTEAINHDPAITFLQTGSQLSGRPSMGAWLSYGLGSDNENLPAFVVLITPGKVDQPLYSRLWGSGFLSSRYQGVQFRGGAEPVLYLNDPQGMSFKSRRLMLDRLRECTNSNWIDPAIPRSKRGYQYRWRSACRLRAGRSTWRANRECLDCMAPTRKPGTLREIVCWLDDWRAG
jgi:hypothetical protein